MESSTWTIIYTLSAQNDFQTIKLFLESLLIGENIVNNICMEIINTCRSLSFFPYRNPIYHDEPWKSLGVRFAKSGNYVIFYNVDENRKLVEVLRIFSYRQQVSSNFPL